MHDRRFPEVRALIASGDFDLLSLDLFDTVVYRTIPAPTDLFVLLGRELAARGHLYPSSSPESFHKERVDAEQRSRRKAAARPPAPFGDAGKAARTAARPRDARIVARPPAGSTEVTLADIYAQFPAGYLRNIAPNDVAALEFELERRVVRVNPDMRDLIAFARARGLRVAFVSDTYFTPAQVDALVPLSADHRILSCEEGRPKALGLHRVLLERTGLPPHRVLHVGNDLHADVEGPARLGIRTHHFRVWPEAFEGMIERELPSTLSDRAALLVAPDGGMTTLRSIAMNSVDGDHAAWGAGVLGPLVTGFGAWIQARCRDLGIRHVLCLMREGRIFRETLEALGSGDAADVRLDAEEARPGDATDARPGDAGGAAIEPAAPRPGGPLVARELFVSRYAVRRASLFTGSAAELEAFLHRPSPVARGRLLEQLGLSPADDGGADPAEALGAAEVRDLARRLARHAGLRRRIVTASARARRSLLAHLAGALGGERPGTVALVDLGYKGTIQEGLQRILDHEGWAVRTHGLYLVTGGDVHETQSTGAAVEGWLAENGQPIAMAHTFMRSPEFVEQSLMAPCGTTLGHEEDGTPVLDEPRVPAEQRARIDEVQRGIAAWTRLWVRRGEPATGGPAAAPANDTGVPRGTGPDAGTGAVLPSDPGARRRFQAIAIRTVARPLPVELSLFGDWTHDENFGSDRCRTLADVEGLDPWEAAHMSAHQLASLPMQRLYWPFGFAHRLGDSLGEAVAGIYLRTVDPRTFDAPAEANVLVSYWDTGRGFNADEARVQPYRVSHRGTVWQRFSVRPRAGEAAPHRLGFTIGLKDQVIRLAGVRVTGRGTGSTALYERRIPHDELEGYGYRHLGRGLYLVEEDPALLVVPVDSVPGAARQVDVDLFFGHVPGAA